MNKTLRVHSGQFNRKASFFEWSQQDDGTGGTLPGTRDLILETFAEIKPLRGQRSFEAFQMGMMNPFEITIRFRKEFDHKQKYVVEADGAQYTIKSIMDVDYRQRVVKWYADRVSPNL